VFVILLALARRSTKIKGLLFEYSTIVMVVVVVVVVVPLRLGLVARLGSGLTTSRTGLAALISAFRRAREQRGVQKGQ
jgi:hypothetical protein